MKYVKAEQIKGARAMLGWTREELAEASGLSHNTIRNLEMGFISPRGKTLQQLCIAIEEAGLEFTEAEGIQRLRPDIKIIRGADSHDVFFEILLSTVKINGGEITAIFNSQHMMVKALGIESGGDHKRLKSLLVHADVRCLFSELDEIPLSLENYQHRMAPKYCNCVTPYFVYGNSYVVVQPHNEDTYRFVIFNDIDLAVGNKKHFNLVWEIATPFYVPAIRNEKERIRV